MDESPLLSGSQTRVCDTGPQFTAISLFRCGSQRHSAIRTSRPRVSGLSGSDPETQRQQLLAAGVALSGAFVGTSTRGSLPRPRPRLWYLAAEGELVQGTWVHLLDLTQGALESPFLGQS